MNQLDTKQKILHAAKELFVQYGFAGTSMGKIAKQAHVNHSLLFHHFGNKENLWVAVKQHIVEENLETKTVLPSTQLPFAKFIAELFLNAQQFFKNNPDIVQLINWQRVENRDDSTIKMNRSSEALNWKAALQHYQRSGELRQDIDLDQAMIFLSMLTSAYAMDRQVFLKTKTESEAYLTFVIENVLRAFSTADS